MSQQQSGSKSPTVRHTVATPPEEALKYWTTDKKRRAKPAPQPHIDAPDREKQQAPHSPQSPDAQKS